MELLVSITIFAVVAASVYSSLYLGIKIWKREAVRDESLYQAGRVLETLACSLRGAFMNSQNERVKFIGTADRLDFFSVSAEGDLENVVVYCAQNDTPGSNSLSMSRKKIRQLDDDNISPKVAVLNKKVRVFGLRYFDAKDQTWYDEWPEEQRLPNQIRVEFGCGTGADGAEPDSLVKYVMVPVANEINMSETELPQ